MHPFVIIYKEGREEDLVISVRGFLVASLSGCLCHISVRGFLSAFLMAGSFEAIFN